MVDGGLNPLSLYADKCEASGVKYLIFIPRDILSMESVRQIQLGDPHTQKEWGTSIPQGSALLLGLTNR